MEPSGAFFLEKKNTESLLAKDKPGAGYTISSRENFIFRGLLSAAAERNDLLGRFG